MSPVNDLVIDQLEVSQQSINVSFKCKFIKEKKSVHLRALQRLLKNEQH